MTRPGGFVWGCSTCGAVARVLNAKIVRIGGSDDCQCSGWPLDINDDGSPADGMVCMEMGWCGCGNPEDVDRWMVAFLTSGTANSPTITSPLDTVLAYMADGLGWTEHGGGIGGSWLTDDGLEALANLQAALAAFDAHYGG